MPHTNNMGTMANNMDMPGPVIMMMEAPPCFAMVGGWVMAPNADQNGGCNETNGNKTYTEEQESGDSRVMELQAQIESIRFTHEKEKQSMKRQLLGLPKFTPCWGGA